MIAAILAVLFRFGQPEPRPVTIDEALLATFKQWIGVTEHPNGSNRGAMVDRFNLSGGGSLGDPWCASMVSHGYKINGLKYGGPYSPSWFRKDKVCTPRAGAVFLVWFPAKNRFAHTGTVESVRLRMGKPYEAVTVEGNTSSAGSRDGGSCMRRVRAVNTITCVLWRDPA